MSNIIEHVTSSDRRPCSLVHPQFVEGILEALGIAGKICGLLGLRLALGLAFGHESCVIRGTHVAVITQLSCSLSLGMLSAV